MMICLSFLPLGEILVFLLPLTVTDTITFARVGLGGLEKEINDWGSTLSYIKVSEPYHINGKR